MTCEKLFASFRWAQINYWNQMKEKEEDESEEDDDGDEEEEEEKKEDEEWNKTMSEKSLSHDSKCRSQFEAY